MDSHTEHVHCWLLSGSSRLLLFSVKVLPLPSPVAVFDPCSSLLIWNWDHTIIYSMSLQVSHGFPLSNLSVTHAISKWAVDP